MIRLAEGEPQAETRLPCLHQQGTSNALIDGSEKPLSAARRHTERERESSPTAEHTRTHTHTPVRALKHRNPSSGRFLSLKSGAYPTHQSCSGEVAAALSALLRFNFRSAPQQQERRGQRMSIILPGLWLAAAAAFQSRALIKNLQTLLLMRPRIFAPSLRHKELKLREKVVCNTYLLPMLIT